MEKAALSIERSEFSICSWNIYHADTFWASVEARDKEAGQPWVISSFCEEQAGKEKSFLGFLSYKTLNYAG